MTSTLQVGDKALSFREMKRLAYLAQKSLEGKIGA
jgi:hypothetical protein